MRKEVVIAGFVAVLCWIFTYILLVSSEAGVTNRSGYPPVWFSYIFWTWLFVAIILLAVGILVPKKEMLS